MILFFMSNCIEFDYYKIVIYENYVLFEEKNYEFILMTENIKKEDVDSTVECKISLISICFGRSLNFLADIGSCYYDNNRYDKDLRKHYIEQRKKINDVCVQDNLSLPLYTGNILFVEHGFRIKNDIFLSSKIKDETHTTSTRYLQYLSYDENLIISNICHYLKLSNKNNLYKNRLNLAINYFSNLNLHNPSIIDSMDYEKLINNSNCIIY